MLLPMHSTWRGLLKLLSLHFPNDYVGGRDDCDCDCGGEGDYDGDSDVEN